MQQYALLRVRAFFFTTAVVLSAGMLIAASMAQAVPSAAGLVAHWDFDQGSGTTLTNVAGTSYHGTLRSTPTWTAGKIGGALSFDGTDYVSIGNIAPINNASQVTLAGWIKRGASNAKVLMGKQTSGGSNTLAIEAWNDGRIYFGLSTSGYAAGSALHNDTEWHHVALVFDGTKSGNAARLKGYIDGVEQTLAWTGTIPAKTTSNTTGFNIGRITGDYSNGLIDDVWLYARALSAAEIADLAQAAPPPPDTTAPSVAISAPANGASVSGTIAVSATATDNVGVAGVRFLLDGADLGSEDTTAPYSISWNTAGVADGTHTLSAIARDAAGNTGVASAVSVTVDNVPDPDLESPSIPTNLSASAVSASQINLSWTASTDNVGVAGYRIARDGAHIATTTSTSYADSGLAASTTYTYTVAAYDAAGNASAPSAPVAATTQSPPPLSSSPFPLTTSPDKRRLLDRNGNMFVLNGDTPWELLQNLTLAEAETYLEDRRQKGFNAVLIELIEHQYSPNPPYNKNGDAPFTTPGDFSTPNEAYFAHVDAIFAKALAKGIAIFVTPAYLGCCGDGWAAELGANSRANLVFYGQYIANRYRNFPNIVWVMGGDAPPGSSLDAIRAIVEGIRSVATTTPLITVHNARYQSGVTQYQTSDTWITLNSTYSDCAAAAGHLLADYNRVWNGSPMPFFFIEGNYEPGNQGGTCYRSQAYWSVLLGAVGHFFGNDPLWYLNMGTNWEQYLNSPVAQDMIHFRNLFASRNTGLLVPDTAHVVLTAGYGNLSDGSYAAAARTSDGTTVIAYVPVQRTLTIDMTKVAGVSANAWWFNPDTGAATAIGTFANTGTRIFTPPAGGDWVLVLDDAAANLGAPGTGTPPPPPPPPPDTTAPSVAITNPADGATVSGTITVAADASDNIGVAGVRFLLDGTPLGAEDTLAPYAISWDTASAGAGAHTLFAIARDAAGNTASATPVAVTVSAPQQDFSAPSIPQNLVATAMSSSRIDLSWSPSTDNVGVTGYRIYRGGVAIDATSATNFSDTNLSANTTYTYTVVAYDAAGNASAQSASASATTALPPPAPTGLAAAYNFNEGSGTTLTDVSGNGRHGTISGTPAWTIGRNGLTIDYDGANDNVSLGSQLPIQGVSQLTISAWVKRNAANELVEFGKQNGMGGDTVAIELWNDGMIYFGVSPASGYAAGYLPHNDTAWHHVALVFDGTQTSSAARLKGYVDGVQQTLAFTGTIPAQTTTNTNAFNIGAIGGAYTGGLIDDLRVYNRALSAAEIASDMNTPL